MKNASIETKILIIILSILVVVSAGYAGTQLYIRDHNLQKTTVVSEESSEETTTESTTETAEESSTESTTVAESTVTELTSVNDETTTSSSPLAFVYVSANGSKYHTADCSYAENGTKISAEEAVAKGYEPCSVCNPQIIDVTTTETTAATENTTETSTTAEEITASSDPSAYVYVSANGSKYHTADCTYAKNGTKISAEEAVNKGYEPCKICNPQIIDVTTTMASTTKASTTAESSTAKSAKSTAVVYITGSGKKYHTADCRYVSDKSTTMSVSDAVEKGYEPCKICNPDNTDSTAKTTASATSESSVVYITASGKKYHQKGCGYLTDSATKISLKDAVAKGYEPCSACNK